MPLSKEPCFEDDTAYFGNNARTGGENPQKSRLDCQQSCEFHPSCHYWTFRKPDLQSNGDSPAQRGQNLSEVAFLILFSESLSFLNYSQFLTTPLNVSESQIKKKLFQKLILRQSLLPVDPCPQKSTLRCHTNIIEKYKKVIPKLF